MDTITLMTTITEDRRLTLDLPAETPTGPVEVTIRSLAAPEARPLPQLGALAPPLTREEARERLRAAGILATGPFAPPDAVPLTPEERERLGRLFIGPRSIAELIDEDRAER